MQTVKNIKDNPNNNHLPTVTVAVCVYNEESNIGDFLKSVVAQKEEGFILEKILIISDGSTDKTVKIARQVKSPKIEVKDYPQRIGKSSRLNEIYSSLKSDIVVQSDGDVIFANPRVIKNLIAPLVGDERVGMTGGHPLPLPAKTFTEKAVNCTLEVYIPLRKALKGGDNILSATGRAMALRRELAKKMQVPKDTIANDGFAYFSCLTFGYQYRYAENAKVFFRSPQNLDDHINQNTRFAATIAWMSKFFPPQLVKREYHIPAYLLYYHMAKQFIRHPILAGYIFLINRLCHVRAYFMKKKINALWDIVYTTKKLRKAE